MYLLTYSPKTHIPWNKGKLTGQKPPFKLKEIWAIRIHLQIDNNVRDLALFNLAIDSKLRACDLVKLRVQDVSHSGWVFWANPITHSGTFRSPNLVLTDH